MIKYLGRFLEDGLSLTVGTDLFLGFRPDDAPVDCDVLLEREGGRAEAAPFTDHIDWRVQILSRAESYFVAKARSQAAFDLMHSQCGVYFPDPDTDELTYRCNTMFADSIPQFIGQEKPGGAYEWSLNFTIGIERWDRSIAPTPLPPVTEFMRLTFDTSLGDGTVVLPLRGTVDVLVDWDDGETSTWDTSADLTHTYAVEGEYTAKIRGTLSQFGKTTAWTGVEQLTECTTFGGLGLVALPGAFRDAVNLTVIPDSTASTSLYSISYMLNGATAYNGVEMASWDISPLSDATFCLDGSGVTTASWNQVLIGFANQAYIAGGVPASVTFGALGITSDWTTYPGSGQFTNAVDAHNYLANTALWTLTDTVSRFYSLTFDGDDYVVTSDIWPGAADGTALSAFAWVKATSGILMAQYTDRAWLISDTYVIISDNGDYAGHAKRYNFATSYQDGDWHHVGYTWGASTLTLYIDGVDATGEKVLDAAISVVNVTPQVLVIGGQTLAGVNFVGTGTAVNIFPISLTQVQVQTLMVETDPTGTSVSYPMLPGSGQTCTDKSGNGNDGQLGSTDGADSNDPTWEGPYTEITSGGPQ